MALLLALETSSPVCSVALFQDDQMLGLSELRIEKSHSSHITVLIEQLLQHTSHHRKELSGVVVSGGPGSYTGLRIGGATAKGLCFSLEIPLLEVSTLHAMAQEVISYTPDPAQYLYCPMLDARRMEVFTCVLDAEQKQVLPVEPVILTDNFLAELLKERKIIFFGSGAVKWRNFLGDHPHAIFIENIIPNAKYIGQLGYPKYQAEAFEDVAYYEPFYLKEVYITKSL
jgi:tRNA threonylcarbamoyladenosine biosynthesis protein TsaB